MKSSRLSRKTAMKRSALKMRSKNYATKHQKYLAHKRARKAGVAVIVFKDGREKCTGSALGRAEYRARREQAWTRDHGICCLCDQFLPLEIATTEHVLPRGMGGGFRDDRLDNLAVSHLLGNNRKGSMTLAQYKAKYNESQRRAICKGELCD